MKWEEKLEGRTKHTHVLFLLFHNRRLARSDTETPGLGVRGGIRAVFEETEKENSHKKHTEKKEDLGK
jgi:hypothetical protein